jgi:UDP-glucose 4-epimerase
MTEAEFSGKKVLVTGGLGFIGSGLAIRLASLGAELTLVDSMIPEYGGNLFNIQPISNLAAVNISDVRDEHSMRYLVQGQDYLFNLAGQTSHLDSMQNPYPDLEINARAQLSILEACRRHNPAIKVIFASTRQLYGSPQYLPVDEKHPLSPVDVNGINKMAGEWYHLVYRKVYGIRTTVLRLTNTYGPRMRVKDARQTFLGIWIRKVVEEQPFQVFGDGRQLRDYNYIDDVVDALLLCATSPQADGEIFNLGAAPPFSLRDTAETLVQAAGRGRYENIPFPPDRKAIDIGDYYADYRKIERLLGWKPKVTLAEGLGKTVDFYREYGGYYWETQ